MGSHAGDVDDVDEKEDEVVGSRVRVVVALMSLLEAGRGILAGILDRIN